ncbi:MAG TPA: hypothetical protein PK803_02650, partial [Alphaproteobacteria bacterium]|nr:hypothetical protein [Alphaproteobacteria bacterium]
MTIMFLKTKSLRFVTLLATAFLPAVAYAQQPTTTPPAQTTPPSQPTLTTEQVCQSLLIAAKEKLSATEL